MDIYEKALLGLDKEEPHKAVNKGFRMCNRENNNIGLQYYEQEKRGFNSDYDKRHLLENNYNTYPRDNERELCVN